MSGEGLSTDRAPFFDGTRFPRWKVLMQAHLQARGLDVWRVTELGKNNETKAERQYDAIAKSILLSSLCDSVFNRFSLCDGEDGEEKEQIKISSSLHHLQAQEKW